MQHHLEPEWIFPTVFEEQVLFMERNWSFASSELSWEQDHKKTILFLKDALSCCTMSWRQCQAGSIIAGSKWDVPSGSLCKMSWPTLSCREGLCIITESKVVVHRQHSTGLTLLRFTLCGSLTPKSASVSQLESMH